MSGREFGTDERGADLRAVAVRENDPVPGVDEPDDYSGRVDGVLELFLRGPFLTCPDEGIPSHRYEDEPAHAFSHAKART